MYFWKDEAWSVETLSAGYSINNRERATPFFLVPVEKGKYSVYVQCEGFKAVKAKGGSNDGRMSGFITDNSGQAGWRAYNYDGCVISNYKASNDRVQGHPDLKVNGCSFTDQLVETDFYCSFHLEVATEGYFGVQAPPIEKSDHYNYVVSYANFTEKVMEWGSVSIAMDEVNEGAYRGSKWDKTAPVNARLSGQISAPSEVYTPTVSDVEPQSERTESTPPARTPQDQEVKTESPIKIADKPDPKVMSWLHDQPVIEAVIKGDFTHETVYPPPPPPLTAADTQRQAARVVRSLMANADETPAAEPAKQESSQLGISKVEENSDSDEDARSVTPSRAGTLSGGSLTGGSLRGGSLRPKPYATEQAVDDAASQASGSLGGGTLGGGSLRGGTLRSPSGVPSREMNQTERNMYRDIKNGRGITAAAQWAASIGKDIPQPRKSRFFG
nr:MAG: ORF5 [Guiyang Paspalum paspaloides solemo-like virus 1]